MQVGLSTQMSFSSKKTYLIKVKITKPHTHN